MTLMKPEHWNALVKDTQDRVKEAKKRMKTIKIKTWSIFTSFGSDAVPWFIDTSDWDVTNDELSLCIHEQIYGKYKDCSQSSQEGSK